MFRAELKKLGIRECFFWGKDYLEDQLALPENDEVLFTFFGISLSPKRRSRIADIKFGINNKNKILRTAFGSDGPTGHSEGSLQHGKAFLLRDIKDEHYPYKGEYEDFEKNRRWEEHDAVQVTPTGVYFKRRTWYAYLDREKCEWDFTEAIDQTPRRHSIDEANKLRTKDDGKRVECVWRHLPRERQGTLNVFGFVAFDDMLIIDDKGDTEYSYPHIFTDFGSQGPFSHMVATLNTGDHHEPIHGTELQEKFKRIALFPKKFPKPVYGQIHEAPGLGIVGENLNTLTRLRGHGQLFGADGGVPNLKVADLIRIPKDQTDSMDYFAEVMSLYTTTASAYAKKYGEWETKRWSESLGRVLKPNESIVVYEIHRVFKIGDDYTYSSDAY